MREDSMPAAAALAAGLEILLARDPPNLKRLHDVAGHVLLDAMHLLLGIQKTPGHLIAKEGLTLGFVGLDLLLVELHALLLLVVQGLAPFRHAAVERLGGFIRHEGVHVPAKCLEILLIHDCLAELLSLCQHVAISHLCMHYESFSVKTLPT